MAAFSLSPCTADRALRGPSRPETEPPATLASETGHSLATSHPLPPHSVHTGHGICTAAPSMAASKAAGHLPAVTRDQNGSCITSKMKSLSELDEIRTLKCCSQHRQLGHHVSPSCATSLRCGGEDHDLVVPVPKMAIGGQEPSEWQCSPCQRQPQSCSLRGSGLTDRQWAGASKTASSLESSKERVGSVFNILVVTVISCCE